MGGEAGLFPASRLRTSAIRAAWAVWCRAWRSSRPGAQQEQREHAVGFGQIERAFQGPSSISSADLGSSTWAMVISSHGDATRFFVTFLDNHDMKERIRYEMPENPTEFDDQVTLGLGRSSHLRLAAMCQGRGLVAA
jgi:hypothetical protein